MGLLLVLNLFSRERGTKLASSVEVKFSLQTFIGEGLVLELDRSIFRLNDLVDDCVLVESLNFLIEVALRVDSLVSFEIVFFEEMVLFSLLKRLILTFFY